MIQVLRRNDKHQTKQKSFVASHSGALSFFGIQIEEDVRTFSFLFLFPCTLSSRLLSPHSPHLQNRLCGIHCWIIMKTFTLSSHSIVSKRVSVQHQVTQVKIRVMFTLTVSLMCPFNATWLILIFLQEEGAADKQQSKPIKITDHFLPRIQQ